MLKGGREVGCPRGDEQHLDRSGQPLPRDRCGLQPLVRSFAASGPVSSIATAVRSVAITVTSCPALLSRAASSPPIPPGPMRRTGYGGRAETLAGRGHVLAGLVAQAGPMRLGCLEELDRLRRPRPRPTATDLAYQNAGSPAGHRRANYGRDISQRIRTSSPVPGAPARGFGQLAPRSGSPPR